MKRRRCLVLLRKIGLVCCAIVVEATGATRVQDLGIDPLIGPDRTG